MFPRFQFGNSASNTIHGSDGIDVIFGLGGDDTLLGLGGHDLLFGGSGADNLLGGAGDDALSGGFGNDEMDGGSGADRLYGDSGNDHIAGGNGDDVLTGGSGSDTFYFDPSNRGEGNDRIRDFELGSDKISLNAADILIGDPDLITQSGDPSLLEATDFDHDPSWKVMASKDGDVQIVHPAGKIELDGIAYGASTNSFAELLPALELTGVVAGDAGHNTLNGGRGDQALFGLAGNDRLQGGRGDDALVGGLGMDRFVFNPDRAGEGDDVILDFDLSEDKIVLSVADVLASTPGLLALSGDPAAFESTDLDASELWGIEASDDGDVVVIHPNGTIEINGLSFNPNLNFGSLLPAIDLV